MVAIFDGDLLSDDMSVEAYFSLTVIDVCDPSLPLIEDFSGGRLVYDSSYGEFDYYDQIRLRPGLEKCFAKSFYVVTQLRCYSDNRYRTQISCPYYLEFQDFGTQFELVVDLRQDVLQFDGDEVFLKFVTSTRSGASQIVQMPFEVISICVDSQIVHAPQQDKTLSLYETTEAFIWSYDFFFSLPNCQFRFGSDIEVS